MYEQVDNKLSQRVAVNYGVPQVSIFGAVLLNVHVSKLSETITSECLQYADDTTSYIDCKVKDIGKAAAALQNDIISILTCQNKVTWYLILRKLHLCYSLDLQGIIRLILDGHQSRREPNSHSV